MNGSGTFVRPAFASVRIGNVRMPNRMCGVVARRSGAAESAATEYLLRIRMESRTAGTTRNPKRPSLACALFQSQLVVSPTDRSAADKKRPRTEAATVFLSLPFGCHTCV